MKSELVPEIHDVLKLCEDTKLPGAKGPVAPHSHPDLVYKHVRIENQTWEGVCKHHHGERFGTFPDTSNLFLLHIADGLAAGVSRALTEHELGADAWKKYGIDDKVFKLWKNSFADIKRDRHIRPLNLSAVIEFIAANPTAKEYFEEYGSYLPIRAESATLGTNITSLYTHSKLTGQFYRILKKAGYSVEDNRLSSRETVGDIYNEKIKKWTLKVVRCKVNFSQKPFRVRDLNIFRILKEIRRRIGEELGDYVLFSTFDEFLFVLPPNKDVELLKPFLADYGLWFEFSERIQEIKDLHPDPEKLKKEAKFEIEKKKKEQEESLKQVMNQIPKERKKEVEKRIRMGYKRSLEELTEKWEREIKEEKISGLLREGAEYVELFPVIKPPICEICQMAPAEYTRIDEESGVKEELCKYCWKIQEGGERLTKLAEWTYEEGIKTAWLKVSLDFDKLTETLKQLYIEYLKWSGIPDPEGKAEIRFSVLSEFQLDYDSFLNQLEEEMVSKFGDENVEQILDDFFCVKIDNLSEIVKILSIYKELIESYFPKFKETAESPIKMVISCSHVKFPFFEHWRYLKNPEDDVNVMLVGSGKMKIELRRLGDLLDLELANKTAIEKLARMADVSEELAFMQIFSEEGIKNHPELQEALKKGFNLRDLLTYVKIKSG